MTAAPSYPPVLDPSLSAGERDLAVLRTWARAKRNRVSATTLTHVELARTTLLPALDRINREHIARWQETETERGQV